MPSTTKTYHMKLDLEMNEYQARALANACSKHAIDLQVAVNANETGPKVRDQWKANALFLNGVSHRVMEGLSSRKTD